MRRLPEKWILLHDQEPVQDASTGNWIPQPPTEIPWTGLLQQRQLTSSSVDAGNTEIAPGHVVSSFVLLLDRWSRTVGTGSVTPTAWSTRSKASHVSGAQPAGQEGPRTSPPTCGAYPTWRNDG